jgi:CubicO group peptidase (beta-lactamase class C family)
LRLSWNASAWEPRPQRFSDLSVSVDERVDAQGSIAPGFEPVREAFTAVLREQRGTGAAMAVWGNGRWIVDLWGGTATADGSRLWTRDSIVQPYSVSKPFAAMCALVLIDRGLLDLDAPVQQYWPEFTAPATVRHVLSHQAGVVTLDTPTETEAFYDWDRMCALLAAQQPAWTPGTAHGESAMFFGHLVGEIVRRVDGRHIGAFLHDEICGPAGLDFMFGLTPHDQARAVDLTCLDAIVTASTSDLYRRATTNPPGTRDPAVVNSAAWRAAEIPAINGHGTARGVAGLYVALLSGELLSTDLLREAVSKQCSGVDQVFGHENAWGLGFAIDAEGYGMGGLGGSYGGACTRDGGYAIALLTGTMGGHDRGERVENALRSCLAMPPL